MAEKKDAAKKTSMFDGALFYRHLNKLHDSWLQNRALWGGADALVITAGSQSESSELTKTQALQSWLLSYELPDTVMIITPQKCTFLASSKKVKLLKEMQETVETKEAVVLKLLQRGKQDEDFAALLEELKKSNGGKKIGTMANEVPQGDFGAAWWQLLQDTFTLVDIGDALSTLFAVKDKQEQKWMKTASSIVTAVVKSHMIPEIETIIDEEKQVPHRKIADKIEKLFVNPEQISKALKPEVVDSCFTPVIQSGGTYALTAADGLRSETLDSIAALPLHSSCIILAVGGKYKQYCGVLARTLLVNPTAEQRAQYEFLFDLHNQLIELMRPGVKLSDIYKKAREELSNKYPQLVSNFLSNCGYSIGLELTERSYLIDENNDTVIEDGMTFNVRVGLQDLELNPPSSDPKANRYALLLSDTILVTKEAVETLTKSKKKFSEISYSISAAPAKPVKTEKEEDKSDEAEDEPSEESEDEPRASKKSRASEEPGHRPSLRHRDQKDVATSAVDEKRKANQARLAELQAKQARERYLKEKNKGGDEDDKQDNSLANKDYTSYKSHSEYPLSADREKIYIDSEHDSILLPIYGLLVPFHITTVKSVQKTEEYIRIIFKAPGNVINVNAEQNNAFKDPQAVYVKEVTFRVPNPRALSNHLRLINELKKRVTQRESEKETLAGLKVQEELQVTLRGKPPKLSTLSIRPTLGGRKTVGTLEAHQNGFRFLTAKKGKVDIIYKNIKHAFFQPAEKELIVLIHLRLHNAIMIGKKKTLDVQFFTEVMEVSQALGGVNRRLGRDAEELEDEQREREMRNKLNAEFQNFVKKVEELGVGLEFDIPYRELGFYGVPERNNVFLQPTVHCLVNLTESPFFVLTLDEIEIAYFERVRFSLRNFDVVLVLKDWSKPVVHLNAVPVESLEMIKEWLDSCNIKYYEGVASLNWKRVMTQIRDDPKKFWKDGGWNFLEADSDEEEAGEEEESQDYNPSGSAESEDYEATDSGSSASGSGDGDDDDSGSGSAMDEEEEDEEEDDGEDWDALEARAAAEDKKLAGKRKERGGTFSDDEEEPPRKKKK